jgi:hypothetical protein
MLRTITTKIAYTLYTKRDIGNFKFIKSIPGSITQEIVFKFVDKYYRFIVTNNFTEVDTIESYGIPLYENSKSTDYHVYVDPVSQLHVTLVTCLCELLSQ